MADDCWVMAAAAGNQDYFPLHNREQLQVVRKTWYRWFNGLWDQVRQTRVCHRPQWELQLLLACLLMASHSYATCARLMPFTQPLNRIRDYYGEKVALYAAFAGMGTHAPWL